MQQMIQCDAACTTLEEEMQAVMPLHCATIRSTFLNFQCLPFIDEILENRNHIFQILPLSNFGVD